VNVIRPTEPAVMPSLPAPAMAGRRQAWQAALLVLGLGLAVLGWLFRAEVVAAVKVWNDSTAYNHCWLVLPIAGWLAWTRRDRLSVLLPQPMPLLALLALPLGLGWLAAERLGIMEGRQLAALSLVILLVVTVLGWRIGWAMAAPLAYLYFLVPFGAFLTPQLQDITAWLVDFGLNLTGIPHYVDHLIIEIPVGTFYVAEACAGLRFLIAAIAFGALYALTMFRSPGRRIIVMVLALVVPIIANGIRALGIVVLGHYLGSAEAAAADHVIYGWGFFSAVILLLILAGLPFREDVGPPPMGRLPPPQHPVSLPRLAAAGVLGTLLAMAWPVTAQVLDAAAGGAETVAPVALQAPAGCIQGSAPATLQCGPATVAVRLLAFPPSGTWAPVVAARRAAEAGGGEEDTTWNLNEGNQVRWQARQFPGTGVASAAWLGGQPVGDGVGTRLRQARNSLAGGAGRPVLAVVTLRTEGGPGTGRERGLLQAVLQAQGEGLVAQARALSQPR